MTRAELAERLNAIAVAIGRQPVTAAGVAVYWRALTDAGLSLTAVETALSRHVSGPNGRQWPAPRDVLDLARGEQRDQVSDAIEDQVARAVEALDRMDRRYYRYGPQGSSWDLEALRRDYGREAVEALSEAGGTEGLESAEWGAQTLRRFAEAYRRRLSGQARAGALDPNRLLPQGAVPSRLVLAGEAREPLDPDTARQWVQRLRAAAEGPRRGQDQRRLRLVRDEQRLSELQEQADRLRRGA